MPSLALSWHFSGKDPERRDDLTLRIMALSFFALAAFVTVDDAAVCEFLGMIMTGNNTTSGPRSAGQIAAKHFLPRRIALGTRHRRYDTPASKNTSVSVDPAQGGRIEIMTENAERGLADMNIGGWARSAPLKRGLIRLRLEQKEAEGSASAATERLPFMGWELRSYQLATART